MSDEAKNNMILCYGLSADEQKKLEPMEGDILRIVHNKLGQTDRPIWVSSNDEERRVIRLCLIGSKSSTLMEITSSELAASSPESLLKRILDIRCL